MNPVSHEGHFRGEDLTPDPLEEINQIYDLTAEDQKTWEEQKREAEAARRRVTRRKATSGIDLTSDEAIKDAVPDPSDERVPVGVAPKNDQEG